MAYVNVKIFDRHAIFLAAALIRASKNSSPSDASILLHFYGEIFAEMNEQLSDKRIETITQ